MPFHKLSIVDSRLTIVKKPAFTLIELLIVITIIGILASLTLTSFANAQQKARDGVRKSDLGQIKRAMELAKSDCSGSAYYPNPGTTGVTGFNDLNTYLIDADLKYMTSTLKDPSDNSPQQYAYQADATVVDKCPTPDTSGTVTYEASNDYTIWVKLERTADADSVKAKEKCVGKPGNATWNAAGVPGYYVVCN